MKGIWKAAWLASVLVPAATAHAGNDDSILLGNDAALTGGAVVATTNDGSALWYNPAGLALASGDSVDVGASAFALRMYSMPGLITTTTGARADASVTEFVSVPSALTYVRRLDARTTLGFGLFASQVSDSSLRTSLSAPLANDLRMDMLVTLRSEVARYHAAGGWAMKLPRGFSVGVSLFGDYYDSTTSALASLSLPRLGQTFVTSVYSETAQNTLIGFHVRAGVRYAPSERMAFAVSLESPNAYFWHKRASFGLQSAGAVDPSTNEGQLQSETAEDKRSRVALGLYAPVRARFGAALDVGGALISVEGDVASRMKDSELELDRRLSWNVRAGALVPMGEHYRVGVGFFTDRGPERRDASGGGPVHYYGGTVGAEYQNHRLLQSESDATQHERLTFSSTVALRYAYGHGKQGAVLYDLETFETRDRAATLKVHELTLHIGSGLYF